MWLKKKEIRNFLRQILEFMSFCVRFLVTDDFVFNIRSELGTFYL